MTGIGKHLRPIVMNAIGRRLLKLGGRIQARGQMLVFAAEGHPVPRPRSSAGFGVLAMLLALVAGCITFQIGRLATSERARAEVDAAWTHAQAQAQAEVDALLARFPCTGYGFDGRLKCVEREWLP